MNLAPEFDRTEGEGAGVGLDDAIIQPARCERNEEEHDVETEEAMNREATSHNSNKKKHYCERHKRGADELEIERICDFADGQLQRAQGRHDGGIHERGKVGLEGGARHRGTRETDECDGRHVITPIKALGAACRRSDQIATPEAACISTTILHRTQRQRCVSARASQQRATQKSARARRALAGAAVRSRRRAEFCAPALPVAHLTDERVECVLDVVVCLRTVKS